MIGTDGQPTIANIANLSEILDPEAQAFAAEATLRAEWPLETRVRVRENIVGVPFKGQIGTVKGYRQAANTQHGFTLIVAIGQHPSKIAFAPSELEVVELPEPITNRDPADETGEPTWRTLFEEKEELAAELHRQTIRAEDFKARLENEQGAWATIARDRDELLRENGVLTDMVQALCAELGITSIAVSGDDFEVVVETKRVLPRG